MIPSIALFVHSCATLLYSLFVVGQVPSCEGPQQSDRENIVALSKSEWNFYRQSSSQPRSMAYCQSRTLWIRRRKTLLGIPLEYLGTDSGSHRRAFRLWQFLCCCRAGVTVPDTFCYILEDNLQDKVSSRISGHEESLSMKLPTTT